MDHKPLALIERLGRDGQVQHSVPIHAWPFAIGRAVDADLVLDDPHVAAHHAHLSQQEGALVLTLGETLNGAMVGTRHLQAGQSMPLPPGHTWRVGDTRLRVRLASEPVAPEVPLARHLALRASTPVPGLWRDLAGLLVLVVMAVLAQEWLDKEPGDTPGSYLTGVLAMLAMVGIWTLLWALASKLFQGRLDFPWHGRLALRHGLLWAAAVTCLPLLAYVLDMPWLSHITSGAGSAVVCALVWAHLAHILPRYRRGLGVAAISLYASAVGLNIWFNQQREGRWLEEAYVATLPPPAWRLAPSQPPAQLIHDARALKATLDAQAQDGDAELADEDQAE